MTDDYISGNVSNLAMSFFLIYSQPLLLEIHCEYVFVLF